MPVRHGEGKLVVRSQGVFETLEARGLVALRYVSQVAESGFEVKYPDDPNGSVGHIAGICDPTGRVLGLMPHPEAFLYPENHPNWTAHRLAEGGGLAIFRNGVQAALGWRR
jgi:phosphoribosylformylglycinamidine synthase